MNEVQRMLALLIWAELKKSINRKEANINLDRDEMWEVCNELVHLPDHHYWNHIKDSKLKSQCADFRKNPNMEIRHIIDVNAL